MNDDFSALWQSQKVISHDHEKLLAKYNNRQVKDRLSFVLVIIMAVFTIGLASEVVFSQEIHWSKKVWVGFWSAISSIYFVGYIWLQKRYVFRLSRLSTTNMLSDIRKRTGLKLSTLRIAKPISIALSLTYLLFVVFRLTTQPLEQNTLMELGLKTLFILFISVLIWLYSNKKRAMYKTELQWLDGFENEEEKV